MISEEHKKHQKHAKLKRPELGQFGRKEVAILGTPCGVIKQLANDLISSLDGLGKIGFVDADHKAEEMERPEAVTFTDKIHFRRFDYLKEFNSFQLRQKFNDCELVIVNGNHFIANAQIVVIDPKKPLERKLDRLNNPILVLKKERGVEVPTYLQEYIKDLPVFNLDDRNSVIDFVKNWHKSRESPLKGLVLAGGKSVRMKKDKGSLRYYDKTQREHLYDQLHHMNIEPMISCRAEQVSEIEPHLSTLIDKFEGLGPMGALLSAFQSDPDCAWLAIACDLPHLSEATLKYLVENRDPSKIATAFVSPYDEFPEPLITIWEPRSYSVLFNFLSQGYSCPRKVLINSDVKLLSAPAPKDLSNVNHPEEYEEAKRELTINN